MMDVFSELRELPRTCRERPWAALRLLVISAAVLSSLWIFVAFATYLGPREKFRYVREMGMALLAVAALVGWGRAVQGSLPRRLVLLGLLVMVTSASFFAVGAQPWRSLGTSGQVHVWGTFHYYLGAKYFDELRYDGLYDQALAADRQGKRRFRGVKLVRDLRDNQTKRLRGDGGQGLKRNPRWSDARWRSFVADVDYLGRIGSKGQWKWMFQDRGYNASPAYTFFAEKIADGLSLQDPGDQRGLVLLDQRVIFLAFLFSIYAFGLGRSLLVLGGLYLWYGNEGRLFGQFFVYGWFAAAWIGVSAWRLGWGWLAGAAIGYAAMMRIFPVVLLLGPAFLGVRQLLRERKIDRKLLELAAGAALTMLLLFGAGATVCDRGIGLWADFAANISMHNETHKLGAKRIGLGHVMGADFRGGLSEKPRKGANGRFMKYNRWIYRSSQAFFAALLLLAWWRADEQEAMLLGAAVLYFGTVASRYYGSLFVLLLLLGAARGGGLARPPRARLFDALFFLISLGVIADPARGPEDYHAFMWGNVLLGLWFAWLLGAAAMWGPSREAERASSD